MKKIFLLSFILKFILLVVGCANNPFLGVGGEVDIIAPTVEITSHSNLDYFTPSFTLSGNCYDNVEVVSATVNVKMRKSNGTLKDIFSKDATVYNDKWSCKFTDEFNGYDDAEYIFDVYVYDERNNTSSQSYRSITLILDTLDPFTSVTLPDLLTNKSDFSDLHDNDFDVIDYFQNQTFSIIGESDENFRLASVNLKLVDQSGFTAFDKTFSYNEEVPQGVRGSLWNWTFDIDTENDLKDDGRSLDPAMRYFYDVYVTTRDVAGNTNEDRKGVICVHPDSDRPWSEVASINENDSMAAAGQISGNAYDDDGIAKVYLKAVPHGTDITTDEYASWDEANNTESISEMVIDRSENAPRIYTWNIQVPVVVGEYTLYIMTEDINGTVSSDYTILNFTISDVDTPIVEVLEPTTNGEYRIATDVENFDISGTWSDNGGVIDSVTVKWVEGNETVNAVVTGENWSVNSSEFNLTSGSQNFKIIATDSEGNEGIGTRFIIIDNNQPVVTNVTSSTPNGIYTTGELIDINVEFSKVVRVTGSPRLLLNTGSYATYDSGHNTSTIKFTYTVQDGDNTSKLAYKSKDAFDLSGATIKDAIGNNAITTLITPGDAGSLSFNKTITFDTMAPTLSSHAPLTGSEDVDVSSTIVLNFSESVYRETGDITITRTTKGFPVIMSADEYTEFISGMSIPDQNYIDDHYMVHSNGYKIAEDTPDTSGKYILKSDRTPSEITNIKDIFDRIGYNTKTVSVTSNQVTGSGTATISINLHEELDRGVDYYINVPNTAFRDVVGLNYGGIDDISTWSFTTGPVATPVIRVNKQSGAGDSQPQTTTFEIDCDTEGASVYYTMTTDGTEPADPTTASTPYASSVTIGNADYNGQKVYIKARAFKTGFASSDIAGEMAYKTVLGVNDGTNDHIWFRGSDNDGGPITAPGFPLSWYTTDYDGINLGVKSGDWYWITWAVNVTVQFQPLQGDKPGDWVTMGPSWWRWKTGDNASVDPGERKVVRNIIWESGMHNREE